MGNVGTFGKAFLRRLIPFMGGPAVITMVVLAGGIEPNFKFGVAMGILVISFIGIAFWMARKDME